MTTSDNDVDIPVTNEVPTPRSVSMLLHILETDGTYQGMTDEEIQSIIDYKIDVAHANGRQELMQSVYVEHCESMETLTAAALQEQASMLQSIIDRASNPHLQVVDYG